MAAGTLLLGLGGAVAAGLGAYGLGQFHARRLLNPIFRFEPNPARLGSTIHLELTLLPRRPLELEWVEVRLTCQRTARVGEERSLLEAFLTNNRWSSGRESERDVVCENMLPLVPQPVRLERRSYDYEGELLVPSDGFPTRPAGKLRIQWTLRVIFHVRGLPNPVLTRSLPVIR